MSKRTFRNLCLVFLIGGIGLLTFQAVKTQARDKEEPDQKVWIGTITIEETGSAFLKEDNSTKDYIATYYKNSEIHDKVTLWVCGPGGPLRVNDIKRTYDEYHIKESFSQRNHKLCSDGTRKEPGNSTRTEERTLKEIYDGPYSSRMREYKADLSIMPDGTYYLFASSVFPVNTEMESKSEVKWVCSGETEISEIHYSTCTPDQKGGSSILGQGTKHTEMFTTMPPTTKLIGGTLTGRMKENTISGEMVLFDDKPSIKGGLSKKGVATWDLQYVESTCNCTAYIRRVEGDVKINGKEVKEGVLPGDLKGAEIETGPKSRLQIDFGNTMFWIAPNSSLELPDPCPKLKDPGILRHLYGKLLFLIDPPKSYIDRIWEENALWGREWTCIISNAVAGVRGEIPHPDKSLPGKIHLASLHPLQTASLIQEEAEYSELVADEHEIKKSAHALMIDNTPYKPLIIKVIKGEVEVEDSTGDIFILKEGEVFTKDWKPAIDPKKVETVTVRAKVN